MVSKSTIKYIQSLQHKKFRDEYGLFIAEGPKVVLSMLQSGIFEVNAIFALQGWVESLDNAVLKRATGKIEIVLPFELEKLANYTTANQVVAVFQKRSGPASIPVKDRITLVLDDIQDPGNLGTIIRIADWFGIEQIVCSVNTVDMYNSKVVQSTMASLGVVNLTYVELTLWLNEQEVPVYAATLDGITINNFHNLKEGIIIIGNESRGISKALIDMATEKISIPKIGQAESLNAAVATGIILAKILL